MNLDANRFDEYQLVVLKTLWLMSDNDWKKYRRLRRELSRYLVSKGYLNQTMRDLLTQKDIIRYRVTIPLGAHLREYLNDKIKIYNQNTKQDPIELIEDLTELYQKREVLVA